MVSLDIEYQRLPQKINRTKEVNKKASIHYWNEKSRLKWIITYFIGVLLVYSVRSSMSICATAIGNDLGWNKHISGMALSAFFCGYVTTNVIGGYLADRYGGEIVIFYTALGWSSLTMALPILAHSNVLFSSGTVAVLTTRFLTGVTQGVFFPSLTAILSKHIPINERAFSFSFTYSGASVGTVATGFVGSLIIEHLGWPHVFILIGVLSLLWVIWMRYLHLNEKVVHEKDIIVKEHVPWKQLACSKPVWALFISYFCQSFCFFNLLAWTPVYFHDAFPQSKGWIFNVIPWLCAFLVGNASGFSANKLIASGASITYVRKLFATTLFIGMAVFSLLLTSVESFQQALFIMTLNIGVNSFATISIQSNSQDLAPKHAGALHGFMNSNGAFAGFVGVYLTGHILETTGSWSSVFILTSVLSMIGWFSFMLFGTGEAVV